METKFKFSSQICTTREQSERLLALGLKKETADCYLFEYDKEKYKVIADSWLNLIADEQYYSKYKDACFPAWSLGRLINLMPRTVIIHTQEGDARIDIDIYAIEILVSDDSIAEAVSATEWLIKEGYFNKEYLV